MAIIRVPKVNNYTVMSNHHLLNPALSLKAKGLMSYMLSRPDSCLISVSQKRAAAYRRYAYRRGLGMPPQQAGRIRGDRMHCLQSGIALAILQFVNLR